MAIHTLQEVCLITWEGTVRCAEPFGAQVLSKPEASERKFGLLDCNHAFCLGCIRDWRSRTEGGADVETVRQLDSKAPLCHHWMQSYLWKH